MLFRQLVSATLENVINRFLATQTALQSQLKALQGKRLCIFLDVLDEGVTLIFDERVMVVNGPDSFEQAKSDLQSDTCVINTKISVIGKLSDTSQLTTLIQNKELDIAGDLSIAQKVSDILASDNIDLEEALAHYTSDVFAHGVGTFFSLVHKKAKSYVDTFSKQASDVGLEERPIAARRQGVEGVGMQIETLRDDVERLSLKLNLYEQRVRDTQCD